MGHLSNAQGSSTLGWSGGVAVLAISGNDVFSQVFSSEQAAAEAAHRLHASEDPRAVLGWSAKRLSLDRIKSVEWVPSRSTLLVSFAWWRDPWRITFQDAALGHMVFQAIGQRVVLGQPSPESQRVRPNDLQMDPKVGLPVLLVVGGLIALIGGAIEGPAQAAMVGPAARFAFLADIGGEIGPVAAMAIGFLCLLAGIASLVYWFRTRPEKLVIRRS